MSVDKARLATDFSKMQSQSKHNKKNVDTLKKTVRRLQLKVCCCLECYQFVLISSVFNTFSFIGNFV